MTHPIKGIVAVSAAALFLSGCDSWFSSDEGTDTSSSQGTQSTSGGTGASFDDQFLLIDDLNFELSELSNTPSDQMRDSGTATYEGVVGFSNDSPAVSISDYDMMSDLTLQADFGTGAMTGTMDNFNTRGDVDMDGSLTLTEGEIKGTNFTANAIGSFTDGTDAEIWDLEVVADFIGANGSAIEGTAQGTISNGGSVTTEVFGDMMAVEN
ncbi:hypothetical protein [Flavimaricola marinus]|uniref:Transferrin-binding protein B C-lobe/N-lobe beta barrel domain-containing protein n=1 Tax=Flavimaricola marinus TaxID=1819565 RepID=A0A238LDQ2_9RHOB|nr:hypothetical protein [Flavimaricola marinus]SMY07086.1 hypothetical protein LOM8899_01218 [Flavimaricola marinus]